MLTGETFPIEKSPGDLPADAPLARRTNVLFQGTHVASGTGRALVMHTGRNAQFGAIADRLRIRPDETDFERGVRQFGMLLIRVTLILVIIIFGLRALMMPTFAPRYMYVIYLICFWLKRSHCQIAATRHVAMRRRSRKNNLFCRTPAFWTVCWVGRID